jgi:hypothetical protein
MVKTQFSSSGGQYDKGTASKQNNNDTLLLSAIINFLSSEVNITNSFKKLIR